ncbi:MFS general substrate transporter [Glonium stellatum]|uniref:MFS general substrate transporter n=1 Tax=Glonium stellatum TaxID=574774 RepID=A0A8E2ERM6_9PEZI|nr:MFS general substrate transporter [Glonium stellatum]
MSLISDAEETSRDRKRNHITRVIDSKGFNYKICAASSIGLFAASYGLLATNGILPALAFVYWDKDTTLLHETNINVATLAGSITGATFFGYLGDKYGRTKPYKVGLIILIVTTIQAALSSTGVGGSLSIDATLLTWRFFMGIGIGAIFPLSAIIASEWASVQSRARMLATVTVMQPVAQLCAYLVCFFVLLGLDRWFGFQHSSSQGQASDAPVVDRLWRWVIGAGAFVAVVPIFCLFDSPDPGRYTLDVRDKGDQAVEDTNKHFGLRNISIEQPGERENVVLVDQTLPRQFSWKDMRQCFLVQGKWRYLAGTSLCWAAVDFSFCCLGMNNERILAHMFAAKSSTLAEARNQDSDHAQNYPIIFETIRRNLVRSILTISITSVIGGLVLIKIINNIPRRKAFAWSLFFSACALATSGVVFFLTIRTVFRPIAIGFYAFCELLFGIGPNALAFIIPAEIFPTRYRCFCFGISAASGKLGALTAQAILPSLYFGGVHVYEPNSNGFGWVFIMCSIVMVFGSLFAWAWIPDVQYCTTDHSWRFPSIPLEGLSDKERPTETNIHVNGNVNGGVGGSVNGNVHGNVNGNGDIQAGGQRRALGENVVGMRRKIKDKLWGVTRWFRK